jgi:sugar phosphate isomerase/epimerase
MSTLPRSPQLPSTSVKRRELLRTLLLGFASLAAHIRWRTPCWAQPLGLPIGVELFTLRHECAQDFEGTLEKAAAIGYKEVELFDFYGRKESEIRRILTSNGLTAPSAHALSYNLTPNDKFGEIKSKWEKQIEYAKNVGVRYMSGSIGGISPRHPLEDYKRLADLLNMIGEQCKEGGIQFTYHNLNSEFRTIERHVPYDDLLRWTDPKLVQLEIDCYWLTRAGKDPAVYFKAFPGRIPLLHIKDRKPGYAPTTEPDKGPGPFTEVGRGSIDWKLIFAAAPEGGVKHYYVEQDFCDRPVFESLEISYQYLMNLKV